MSETKQVTGVSQGVTDKPSGWTEFAIDSGGQYPLKLSTKIQEIIEMGRAATVAGQLATWTFEESQGNPNPHKPGTFYMNRTLSKVEVGGTQTQPDATASPTAAPARPPVLGGDKDRLIVRQTCIKAAAALYQGQGYWSLTGDAQALADTPLAILNAAARFETWVYRNIDEVPFD